jgi:hypothetical protein
VTAYNFKARFAEPILAGTKGGTIRMTRKVPQRIAQFSYMGHQRPGGHARPGEILQLYTGMRTKQCRRIGERRCASVEPIILKFIQGTVAFPARDELFDLEVFARFDGFESWPEMAAFFRGKDGLIDEFDGWHIRWLPLPELPHV